MDKDKKIYYALVARGETILADFQEGKNNSLKGYTQDILKKIKTGRLVLEYDT